MGLFTGMSVLSFCEVVFWMFKLLFNVSSGKKPKVANRQHHGRKIIDLKL